MQRACSERIVKYILVSLKNGVVTLRDDCFRFGPLVSFWVFFLRVSTPMASSVSCMTPAIKFGGSNCHTF